MLRRVALVRTDISEEISASYIRVITIGELGKTLAVTNNRRTLGISSQRASVLIKATRRNIPEDAILYMRFHLINNSAAGPIPPSETSQKIRNMVTST
jgi:hypothetical protein